VIQDAVLYLVDAADADAGLRNVARRPVAFRAVMAAVRAGCTRVAVPPVFRHTAVAEAIAATHSARDAVVWLEPGAPAPPRPHLLIPAASVGPGLALAPLLCAAPGHVLEAPGEGAAPVVVLSPEHLRRLWTGLAAGAGVGDAVRAALVDAPIVALAAPGWYVLVRTPAAAAHADRMLYANLGSVIDTPLDTAVHRRLSRPLTRAAVAAGVSPNAVSLGSLALGLAAAGAFAFGSIPATVAGFLGYVAAVVLDHADGEVARLTYTESRLGEILDVTIDTVTHCVLVLAMGFTAQRLAGGMSVWAGLVAAAGIAGSAAVTKRWPAAAPDKAGRLLARIGNRDSYYAMLLMFVAARALFPPALPWLMLLIAVGSHAFWMSRLAHRGRAAEH
jgi:phosphatidylglycerophosphate synthase